MTRVLVTGAKGQLGQSIRNSPGVFNKYEFIYTDSEELDITRREKVINFFKEHQPDYCIHCAAYTNVEKAEEESERCFEINVNGTTNIVEACSKWSCTLIHISTDFVFDGNTNKPYRTTYGPNPINVYGHSKLESERIVQEGLKSYFIIRTSWLYSEYGNNFVKTMIKLGKERDEIRVVDDQIGSPTYAGDLAEFILMLLQSDSKDYGIFHYSNSGGISWYDFACQIIQIAKLPASVLPISSKEFRARAKRPAYSVLGLDEIQDRFESFVYSWEKSLHKCIKNMDI